MPWGLIPDDDAPPQTDIEFAEELEAQAAHFRAIGKTWEGHAARLQKAATVIRRLHTALGALGFSL